MVLCVDRFSSEVLLGCYEIWNVNAATKHQQVYVFSLTEYTSRTISYIKKYKGVVEDIVLLFLFVLFLFFYKEYGWNVYLFTVGLIVSIVTDIYEDIWLSV